MDIVIIGGGLAAAKAAKGLRENGFDGSLTVVAEEDRTPYERPPLSKDVLLGESTVDDAAVEPRAWYEEHDVRLLTGRTVERLDVAQHRVHLDDGQAVPYDKAVLATGARPFVPDVPGAEGAIYLRTADDALRLVDAFGSASSLVVVGGGWIGLEVAAAARTNGLDVTLLERGDQPLHGVLGARLGEHVANLHRHHGVDVRTGVQVGAITGEGPYAVRVGDEVVEADLVVVGAGVVPNVELAESAGLLVDDGVMTDEHFVTSDPDVLAIGDVAKVQNTALGEALRVEHWDVAGRQGEAVARVLLGEDAAYDWQPYFFTDQYDLGMEYVGHGSGDQDLVLRGEPDDEADGGGEYVAFWLDGDTVTAAMHVNLWDTTDDLRALVGRQVDRERLADPSVELSEV